MNFLIKYQMHIHRFLLILFAGVLCAGIYRDYKNQQSGYPCDLRKRIVGARYMAKGYSPYFFKWTPDYPAELCLQYEGDSTFKQNIVTLPPSYNWLLQPLAPLPFPLIEKIWFAFQYISILLIFYVFYFKSNKLITKNLLLLLFSFLLLSRAWIMNVHIGQSYILFPLLLSLTFVFFNKHPKALFYYGLSIGICIWLRPSYAFFALPFLMASNRKLFLKGLVISGIIAVVQICLFHQLNNWLDFFKSSRGWLQYYSGRDYDHGIHFDLLVVPPVIEGQSNFHTYPMPGYIANIPFELRAIFDIYASPAVYYLILLMTLVILSFVFFYKNKVTDPTSLLLIGFFFNYLSEVFIWIPKCDYYFVELFFPLSVLLFNWEKASKAILVTLFTGLFFSAHFFKIIPMQLLLGEYLIAFSLFLYLYSNLPNKPLLSKIFS